MLQQPRLFLLALLAAVLLAGPPVRAEVSAGERVWYDSAADGSPVVRLHLFWSETCPHCARALPAMRLVAGERPWLRLELHEVERSRENRALFLMLARGVGADIGGVPAFFLCGRMLVGFDQDGAMAARIASLADACHGELLAQRLPSDTRRQDSPMPAAAQETLPLPWLGEVSAEDLSLPLLTVLLGGLDAFNPCAFFVLLFLLSLMVHARSRSRMALVGGLFVLVSGLLYFAFMAAWLNLFLLLEGFAFVTTAAGLLAVALGLVGVRDFLAAGRRPTLAIPERAKPGLFARMRGLIATERLPTVLFGTAALAIAANSYELLCTSGLPMVFTRILTLRTETAAEHYLFLALYNLVYVLPLLVIVLLFTATLGRRRLSEREGRRLKLISGLMMLGLGLVLLVAPERLQSPATAGLLLLGALAGGLLASLVEGRLRRPESG